ncbi:ubiquitin thioesterase otulin [Marmota marmota marmota]|nr:ubiquitin thioesterase otulin [Marmota marmota marmota]
MTLNEPVLPPRNRPRSPPPACSHSSGQSPREARASRSTSRSARSSGPDSSSSPITGASLLDLVLAATGKMNSSDCTGSKIAGRAAVTRAEESRDLRKRPVVQRRRLRRWLPRRGAPAAGARDRSERLNPHLNIFFSLCFLLPFIISFPFNSSLGEIGSEEDMYRAADEIEKEKELLIHERGASEPRLSVAPEMDIMDYCKKEWRGNTQKATCMKKGYEEVSQKFTSIRRVRGDNYCALRATLFQAMSQLAALPLWLQDPELTLLPEKLIHKYSWIKQWKLGLKFDGKSEDLVEKIKESLTLLRKKWASLAEMRTAEARQMACDELFTNEEEEYCLYEAVKFLMLNRAIELYDDKEKGKEVPFFSVLLFARDTSNDPGQLLRNHLNQVGHTGGLEQVEMFLLAYAVRHTIQVYRLSKYNTEEFITVYPTDPPKDWPVVTLIAEDDRHYNIPVRVCEETSL